MFFIIFRRYAIDYAMPYDIIAAMPPHYCYAASAIAGGAR